MAEKRIPKRSEVPTEFTWKLEDLFETEEQWFTRFEEVKGMPSRIAGFQGKLGESAENLLSYMILQDEVSLLLEPLFTKKKKKKDEDTANNHYQDLVGKAMGTYVAIDSARAFATPEIMMIDEDTLNNYYEEKPELKQYKRVIDDIRRKKAHVLGQEAERVLALSYEMSSVPESIGSVLRSAEMRFPDVFDADGVAHQMTEDNLPFLLETVM